MKVEEKEISLEKILILDKGISLIKDKSLPLDVILDFRIISKSLKSIIVDFLSLREKIKDIKERKTILNKKYKVVIPVIELSEIKRWEQDYGINKIKDSTVFIPTIELLNCFDDYIK